MYVTRARAMICPAEIHCSPGYFSFDARADLSLRLPGAGIGFFLNLRSFSLLSTYSVYIYVAGFAVGYDDLYCCNSVCIVITLFLAPLPGVYYFRWESNLFRGN